MKKTPVKLCQRDYLVSDICWNCRNFDGANPAARVCAAFPNGIPGEIWNGSNNHQKSFPGDHGIRFEPFAPVTAKQAA